LVGAVPSGSYLAMTHATLELGEQANAEAQASWNEKAAVPLTPRTKQQIARFFRDVTLVEPGIVTMTQWRPDEAAAEEPAGGGRGGTSGRGGRLVRGRAKGLAVRSSASGLAGGLNAAPGTYRLHSSGVTG